MRELTKQASVLKLRLLVSSQGHVLNLPASVQTSLKPRVLPLFLFLGDQVLYGV